MHIAATLTWDSNFLVVFPDSYVQKWSLDLIYQKMNQEENVSLTPPQTVGFDSRTKSEIIGGLSSGASAVDSQSVPEAAGQAAGGVWSASDALLASAPGLAGVYMFIFIGGIVSWVIFGKRGG